MIFSDYVNLIANSPIKSSDNYNKLSNMLARSMAENIVSYIRSKESGTNISTKNIKLSVIKSNNLDNTALYSGITFSRFQTYIEFYNTENKRTIRFILDPLTGESFLIGFYSNYKKSVKNNAFCNNTLMINEFYSNMKIINSSQFIGQTANFLLGSNEEPLTDPNYNINKELH